MSAKTPERMGHIVTQKELDDSFQRGYWAFWNETPFSRNPYYGFSDNYSAWRDGWAEGFREHVKYTTSKGNENAEVGIDGSSGS